MKTEEWKRLTTVELTERYREASAEHGRLLDARKTRAANKAYDRAASIEEELKSRGAEAQAVLLALLDDPEPGTRFWAAAAVLPFAPDKSLPVLTLLAEPPMSMVGLSAAMLREQWEQGAYRPAR
ncbi:DUF2019 domain-containing protein [Myxococcus stipitatus]|uniref:DUF2019 domain-containing protein n=1 Tax=Myxococcus stipitatus TaxID=83455 RepID=UPI001F379FBA|nr:DUF2019 domain-containing protein [Myxococcus stipitatus]MCE9670832.1 DUF2019 domain-containing protein [Myxococcus stipitatus]